MIKELIIKSENIEVQKEAKLFGMLLFEELDNFSIFEIKSKKDELRVINATKKNYVILKFVNDKIIPLENIISELKGKTKILVYVKDADEAKLSLETLEIGADGVLLKTNSIDELRKTIEIAISEKPIKLEEAKIKVLKNIGLGLRACIDTCNLMKEGEGMLVGSSSQGLFLVQSEVKENTFAEPRPFRVNAGSIALYILSSSHKTNYLEEIRAGSEVLLINRFGNVRKGYVTRSKIEMRPLVLIEAESEGRIAKVILQNAETVCLVTKKTSIPITELKEGDKILTFFKEGGRHFGRLVKDELIIEK